MFNPLFCPQLPSTCIFQFRIAATMPHTKMPTYGQIKHQICGPCSFLDEPPTSHAEYEKKFYCRIVTLSTTSNHKFDSPRFFFLGTLLLFLLSVFLVVLYAICPDFVPFVVHHNSVSLYFCLSSNAIVTQTQAHDRKKKENIARRNQKTKWKY